MQDLEFIRKIFKENGLGEGDFFKHKHYTIITRPGIEKIRINNGIDIEFEVVGIGEKFAAVKGSGKKVENGSHIVEITSSASANPDTCRNGYYLEMAEKRLKSRLVLMLMEMYDGNVFGEDEGMQDADPDELAESTTIGYIEGLINTSLFDEDQRQDIERGLHQLTNYGAQELIKKLQDNQQNPITQRGNPSKTEIQNHES